MNFTTRTIEYGLIFAGIAVATIALVQAFIH